jgi:paraquat-inducible protein B
MPSEEDQDALPQAIAVPAHRARYSAVWIIPIVAALVAIGLVAERYLSEGPTITINFRSASGVEAGKTFVKYKEVNIGQVTAVRLTEDLARVEVTAKIAKSAAPLMVEDAQFWVVQPRISLSGISGLSTLISGNYIGFEAGTSDKRQRHFVGHDVPPIITGGVAGRQFMLSAKELGSLDIGSPVYYRRINVGQVIAYDLAPDGKSVTIRIFVKAPNDRFVQAGSRFWNASGINVSLGANGLDVQTQSLVSLLEGGLAFETPEGSPGTAPAAADATFTLYDDRATAMKRDESIATRYVIHFSESVRGLSTGAPVTFFGVPVGEVTDVGLYFDPRTLTARPRVEINLYPERMIAHLPLRQEQQARIEARKPEVRHAIMRRMIEERGLRAQLVTASLVTGARVVALSYFPGAPKASIEWGADTPELPAIASALPSIEAKIGTILDRLDKVPFDAIGADLKDNLVELKQTLKDAGAMLRRIDAEIVPALKSTLDDASRALGSAERMLTSTETNLVGPGAPAQLELRAAMQELARAARSLRGLTDYLERHPDALLRGKAEQKAPR